MNEMTKLAIMLTEEKIPFQFRPLWDGSQIHYPSIEQSVCDAICHSGSYGHEAGLLEIMGLVDEETVGDSVEGWLKAEEVFARIQKHWNEQE